MWRGRGEGEGVSVLPDLGSAYRLHFLGTVIISSSLWVKEPRLGAGVPEDWAIPSLDTLRKGFGKISFKPPLTAWTTFGSLFLSHQPFSWGPAAQFGKTALWPFSALSTSRLPCAQVGLSLRLILQCNKAGWGRMGEASASHP